MSTYKQKLLAKKILENPTMTQLTSAEMQAVGYSANTRPSEIENSKGWQELLEKHLPDKKLITKHEELLEATKQISVRGGKDANAETDDFIEVPDYQVQAKVLELGYKVKGKLSNNQINIQNNGDMNMGLLIDENKTT